MTAYADALWVEKSAIDLRRDYARAMARLSTLMRTKATEAEVAAVSEQCLRLKLALQARMGEPATATTEGLARMHADYVTSAVQGDPKSDDSLLIADDTPGFDVPLQGGDVTALRRGLAEKLAYAIGKKAADASDRDWFVAAALVVRDRIVDRWIPSVRTANTHRKHVYYLSMEFLIGRLLSDALNNLGLTDAMRSALAGFNVDLDRIREVEPDAALGNGGLGRLAACFMESMATLSIPAYGYGIRYNHGLFRQVIYDGWQEEYPESWLSFGNPWEFERAEINYAIGFGGHVETMPDTGLHVWHPAETVTAVAYDTPLVGWRGRSVNTLRLWSARASDPLHLDAFNRGDHLGAVATRARANSISHVLYPSTETPAGQELRFRQEYFFSSASLQDLVRRHMQQHRDIRTLREHASIQLNDTHPAIAVPELLRLLLDEHGLSWAEAWTITTSVFSYTNHTLLPEALESWPVSLIERLLPRHMQIIYWINWQHLDKARGSDADASALSDLSLIDESHGRRVRMGPLAFVGSHRINGVSSLHTELMRKTVFRSLHALYPERIVSVTNGISTRRWLLAANPGLTKQLAETVGAHVLDDIGAVAELARHADDRGLHDRLAAIRRVNKANLGRLIADRLGFQVDPDALFDVQIKRIHEYKRQLLNILETIAHYHAIRARPGQDWVPRVKIFAGKAAADYRQAKLVIKLIHNVAHRINNDPAVGDLLKVAFLPNYNVSLAEAIIPAADLSEQISTAGMEASGTGNMKLALNGALTIGTLDGANIEILERVGAENICIFGLTAEQVAARLSQPAEPAARPADLEDVLVAIATGAFSPSEPDRFNDLTDALLHNDRFMVLADFEAYGAAQRQVDARWHDKFNWWRSSIMNTASVAYFSADRAIEEYAREIWELA